MPASVHSGDCSEQCSSGLSKRDRRKARLHQARMREQEEMALLTDAVETAASEEVLACFLSGDAAHDAGDFVGLTVAAPEQVAAAACV